MVWVDLKLMEYNNIRGLAEVEFIYSTSIKIGNINYLELFEEAFDLWNLYYRSTIVLDLFFLAVDGFILDS